MKKVIQICIGVFVCLMTAISAEPIKISQQVDSAMVDEMNFEQVSIPVSSGLADLKNTAVQRRPIEPGFLFLFGLGIIGMITVHRLKFHSKGS